MNKFKLAIDWHGVLDAIPNEITFLVNSVYNNGGEVHILTGMTWTEDCTKQLEELGIKYTHVFSVFDYHHKVLKTPIVGWHDVFNIPKIDDDIWDMTKGDYCRKHNISLHIDDTLQYNKYFTTPFARLWTHNNKPKRLDKDDRHKE